MSIFFTFYAGDPAQIEKLLAGRRRFRWPCSRPTHSEVDFSLHVTTEHLDALSRLLTSASGNEAMELLSSFERFVGPEPRERGAHLVSQRWVEAVATTPSEAIEDLVSRWMLEVDGSARSPESKPPADAVNASRALVAMCQDSLRRGTRVIFTWSL